MKLRQKQIDWLNGRVQGFYDPAFRQMFAALIRRGNIKKAERGGATVVRFIRAEGGEI